MKTIVFLGIAVAAATVFGMNKASAAGCTGTEQYTDDFTDAGVWNLDQTVSISGGKLIFKEPPNKVDSLTNSGFLVGDGDICVDASVLSPITDPSDTYAAVIFWHVDWDNYYELDVAPNGQAALFRTQNGKLLKPIPWTPAASLKNGADAVNSIRITLKGNSISIFLNDTLFKKITGLQPKNGGAMGFSAGAETKQVSTITFSKLRVTDPSQ